jgi:hypothetical protein
MQQFPIGREAFIGVGVSIVLGLAVGGAVKPTMKELQHLSGAEMEVADRDDGTVADADPGLARYGAHLPSWVLGTDALKASQPYSPPPEAAPQIEQARLDRTSDDSLMTPARYAEPDRPETSYPSQGGGILVDRDRPPPHMEDLPEPDDPSD